MKFYKKYLREKEGTCDKLTLLFVKIGAVFLCLNIVKIFIQNYQLKPLYFLEFFWFCNLACFAISLSLIFLKREYLKKVAATLLCISIPAQSIWIFAFLSQIFNLSAFQRLESFTYITNIEGNIFNAFFNNTFYILSLLEHVLLVPICLFVVFKIGFDKSIFKYILLTTFLLCTFSFIISPDILNINCMKRGCDSLYLGNIYTMSFKHYFKELLINTFTYSLSFTILSKFFKNQKV
jgi:hypothetical protein